jgi:hypothetical protein
MYRRIELIDEMSAEDYRVFIESLRQSDSDKDSILSVSICASGKPA